MPNETQRRYFYRVAISLVLLSQALRLLPDDLFDVIANALAAIFAISTPALALPNVPAKPAND